MKTCSLFILCLMISSVIFSQNNTKLNLVPKGSFDVTINGNKQTVTVDNFWMSNEITNKEFRKFFNQVKESPNDSMEWIDNPSMNNGKLSKPKVMKVAYSNILNKLMNDTAWKTIFENKDYFINPKYDNYPVVGVTWEGANYYCIWRTNEENKKLKGKKEVMQMVYRLPTQYEWEYACSFIASKSISTTNELHPINKGDKNKLGLQNLYNNVAEWTSSSGLADGLTQKVVKGSSWKSTSNENQLELVLPNCGTDYIGFRIVRPDLKN